MKTETIKIVTQIQVMNEIETYEGSLKRIQDTTKGSTVTKKIGWIPLLYENVGVVMAIEKYDLEGNTSGESLEFPVAKLCSIYRYKVSND